MSHKTAEKLSKIRGLRSVCISSDLALLESVWNDGTSWIPIICMYSSWFLRNIQDDL